MNPISRSVLTRGVRIMLRSLLFCIGLSAGMTAPVHAETLPPLLPGVEAVLTPQGLRRLENATLPLLLKDLGYDVGQGGVSSWTYQSAAPSRLDSLPAEFV